MLIALIGSRRRAFTLFEVVVALTIVAMIAAVIVAAIGGRIQDSRSAALAQTLTTLSEGVMGYRTDVRRYPKNLRYLSTAPSGVTDLCNQTVPASFLSSWRGPYVKTNFLATGLVLQEMTVNDALELDPVGPYTATTNGALVIVTQDVDLAVAQQLETTFDGNNDLAAGTIRFTLVAAGKGTLRYAMPVRGC
jgi:prepilin-type N-terminal cleavage/methylation domain-containing protein